MSDMNSVDELLVRTWAHLIDLWIPWICLVLFLAVVFNLMLIRELILALKGHQVEKEVFQEDPVLSPGRSLPTDIHRGAQAKVQGSGGGTRLDDLEYRVAGLESGRKLDIKELNLLRQDWSDLKSQVSKMSGIEKRIRESMRGLIQRAVEKFVNKGKDKP